MTTKYRIQRNDLNQYRIEYGEPPYGGWGNGSTILWHSYSTLYKTKSAALKKLQKIKVKEQEKIKMLTWECVHTEEF